MKKFFFYLSFGGFQISLMINIVSTAGYDIRTEWPYILWVMHLGVFIVGMPAVIYQIAYGGQNEIKKEGGVLDRINPSAFLLDLKRTPLWLNILVSLCFVYALVNMVVIAVMDPGLNARNITSPDFHCFRALQLRNFSGFWMVFYIGYAFVFYPFSIDVKNN